MAPNICELIDSLFNLVDYHFYEQNVHYQCQLVPGIYYTDISNRRFLVAIMPNEKPDISHIIKTKEPSVGCNECSKPESLYRCVTWVSTTTLKDSTQSASRYLEAPLQHYRINGYTLSRICHSGTLKPATKSKHDRKPSSLKEVALLYLPLPFINNPTEFIGASHRLTRNLVKYLEITYSTPFSNARCSSPKSKLTPKSSRCVTQKVLST